MELRSILGRAACVCLAAAAIRAAEPAPRTLTFEDRVRAQEAIERVYYRHQIGTTKPFEEAVPRSVLEAKVRKSLEETAALQTYWKTSVTDLMLDRELERMANGTRMPERLTELYAALGNDAFLIKETLVRATLVDRLVHNFYDFDPSMHVAERKEAEELHRKLASGELSVEAEHPCRHAGEVVLGEPARNAFRTESLSAADFAARRKKLPVKIGQMSDIEERSDSFAFTVSLSATPDHLRYATYAVAKAAWADWWRTRSVATVRTDAPFAAAASSAGLRRLPQQPVRPVERVPDDTWVNGSLDDEPHPRQKPRAVWTGTEMIVWGGEPNGVMTGARYDPATDTWRPIARAHAPTALSDYSAVWTGSEMIVWGGSPIQNSGARYNPVSDTWAPTSTMGAPSARFGHTAVWTGTGMVIWGGFITSSGASTDTGGIYDPSTDSWTTTSVVGAPSQSSGNPAVWTGKRMLVIGSGSISGGSYDPVANAWNSVSTVGQPHSAFGSTVIWAGRVMIVWGGLGPTNALNTGARYDPSTDSWAPTTTAGAPAPRTLHSAVWTGREMIVWGGDRGDENYVPGGAAYDPNVDAWRPIGSEGQFPRSSHAAVWTGDEMVVWGGDVGGTGSSGGRYYPVSDKWTPTSTGGRPSGRWYHTAVWTGNEMIIWGGYGDWVLGTGGRYDPATDAWSPTTTTGAPTARGGHTTVWTGHEMIVWGGQDDNAYSFPISGGRYDPISDSWSPTALENAPAGRLAQSAIWTGHEMVVWGGTDYNYDDLADGGRYSPGLDQWKPTSLLNAPSARQGHACVWTGRKMIVWGRGYWNDTTGGQYDPADDSWLPTSMVNAPIAYGYPSAVWTGSRMLIYSYGLFGSVPEYDPQADTWTWTIQYNPGPGVYRHFSTIWTGRHMLIWGGDGKNTGGKFDLISKQWSFPGTSLIDAPSGRSQHTAVWTGHSMIIWGGAGGQYLDSGGQYFITGSETCNGLDDDGDGIIDNGGDALCDDGNACTADTCRGIDGCQNIVLTGDCDDSNACTTGDHCQDGYCVSTGRLNCDDGDVCTYDSCYPLTGCYHSPRSTCDDGNSCTIDSCDRVTGCLNAPAPDGSPCDDGNACIAGESCQSGSCLGGSPVDCDDDNVCTADSCRPDVGCVHEPSVESSCDDGNPCTFDLCDPHAGCVYPQAPTGSACNDYYNCTLDDRCDADGYCVGHSVCDDGNQCTDDYADENAGCQCSHWPSYPDYPCDDGNACTTNDVCNGNGVCVGGVQASCDDGNPCTDDSCDPATGCVHIATAEGTECNDGNACTTLDACDGAGHCLSVIPLDCDDGNPCTVDACNPASGCTHVPATAGTSCADGNACNGAEFCDGSGTCRASAPLNCDDGNPCTDDSCNPSTGCVHTNNSAPCNDGNACTSGDVCGGGACRAGAPVVCNDGNVCTDDACNPAMGCVFTNNTAPCDDGNACTRTDVCSAGVCTGTNAVVCAVLDQCHDAGVCNPSTGACSNPAKPDGTACNDGSLCTTGDACIGGTCTPSFSGLNEPNPRSTGYYKRLCLGPHSGDEFTDADAVCVASVAHAFAGISTVADLCAELQPSQPNGDACDRTDDDLMALALNICRARVCTQQEIDSQCGSNTTVGQSLAASDAILSSASRSSDTCAQAKCLDEEINTGRALEMNSLTLRREGSGVRLQWRIPYLEDGTGAPSKYHVWRRIRGSMAAFTRIGTTADTSFLDGASGFFEYEVTAVMN
ncbi:MAG TPA: hypothetical protein VFV19_04195 [Candidatus Polarisedimenticolaceae bacterium]|nr:hypothetical protein [Candidatus Polarisedimenticolaceae bacterium]